MGSSKHQDNTGRSGATAAQIKRDIEAGLTGDKVPGFDPGAAPLGTDEEAGGAPYDPELMARSRDQERQGRPRTSMPNAANPALQPDATAPRRSYLGIVLAASAAGAIVALLLVML